MEIDLRIPWVQNLDKRNSVCSFESCNKKITKYNFCKFHRNIKYEKECQTYISYDNQHLYVGFIGFNYKGFVFALDRKYYKDVTKRKWYMNPNQEPQCTEGTLTSLLFPDNKVRQKVRNTDWRESNLQFAPTKPYKLDNLRSALPLGGKKGFGEHAIVDTDLLPWLAKESWHLTKGGYASSSNKGLMHRYVVQLSKGKVEKVMVVDHLDGNRLHNTIANLVEKTSKGNAKNRTTNPESGFESVYKKENVYCCRVKGIEIFQNPDPKMCALVADSANTYVYGPGKRMNDNMSKRPIDISYWNLSPEIMSQLDNLKDKYTDYHGVRHSAGKWKASIKLDLGTYETREEAAKAHDIASILLKQGINLNFNGENYNALEVSNMMTKIFNPPK